jgi:hypothetical protein
MSFGPHMAGGCVLIDNRKGDATFNSCVIDSHLKHTNHIERHICFAGATV